MAYTDSMKAQLAALMAANGVTAAEFVSGILGATVEGIQMLPIPSSITDLADVNSIVRNLRAGTLFEPTGHSDNTVVLGVAKGGGQFVWIKDDTAQLQEMADLLAGKHEQLIQINLPATPGAVTLPDFSTQTDGEFDYKNGRYELHLSGIGTNGKSLTGTVTLGAGINFSDGAASKTVGNRDIVTVLVKDGVIQSGILINREEQDAATATIFGLVKLATTAQEMIDNPDAAVNGTVVATLLQATEIVAAENALKEYLKAIKGLGLAGLTTTNTLTDAAIDSFKMVDITAKLATAWQELFNHFVGQINAVADTIETTRREVVELTGAYVVPNIAIDKITNRTLTFDANAGGYEVTYPVPGGSTETKTIYQGGFIYIRYNKNGSIAQTIVFEGIDSLSQGNFAEWDIADDTKVVKAVGLRSKLTLVSTDAHRANTSEYPVQKEIPFTGSAAVVVFGLGVYNVDLIKAIQPITTANGTVTMYPKLTIVQKDSANNIVHTGAIAKVELSHNGIATEPITVIFSYTQKRTERVVAQTPGTFGFTVKFEQKDTNGNILETVNIAIPSDTYIQDAASAVKMKNNILTAINNSTDAEKLTNWGLNAVTVDDVALNVRFSIGEDITVSFT